MQCKDGDALVKHFKKEPPKVFLAKVKNFAM